MPLGFEQNTKVWYFDSKDFLKFNQKELKNKHAYSINLDSVSQISYGCD